MRLSHWKSSFADRVLVPILKPHERRGWRSDEPGPVLGNHQLGAGVALSRFASSSVLWQRHTEPPLQEPRSLSLSPWRRSRLPGKAQEGVALRVTRMHCRPRCGRENPAERGARTLTPPERTAGLPRHSPKGGSPALASPILPRDERLEGEQVAWP